MKTINIEIADDGEVKIETTGFTGSECLKATEDLEKMLGVTGGRTKKKEFYRAATNTNQNRLTQG